MKFRYAIMPHERRGWVLTNWNWTPVELLYNASLHAFRPMVFIRKLCLL